MTASAFVGDVPLVGRTREVAILDELLERSVAGHGSVAMLVGEAGIGKTRTAQELGRIATGRRAIVLWGKAEEDSTAYGPWAAALRPLLATGAVPAADVDPRSDR